MSDLTEAMRKALEWLESQGPTSQFPVGVNFSMIKRAEKQGLVRRVGTERQIFGMVIYEVSDAGRRALIAQQAKP